MPDNSVVLDEKSRSTGPRSAEFLPEPDSSLSLSVAYQRGGGHYLMISPALQHNRTYLCLIQPTHILANPSPPPLFDLNV